MFHPSSKCFFPSRVMGRVLEPIKGARGRVHCWTAHHLIARPYLSIWGSVTLLRGTSAVLWRCLGTFPATSTPFQLFVCHQDLNQELPPLGPVPCRLSYHCQMLSQKWKPRRARGPLKCYFKLPRLRETQTPSCGVSKSPVICIILTTRQTKSDAHQPAGLLSSRSTNHRSVTSMFSPSYFRCVTCMKLDTDDTRDHPDH